VKTAVIILFHGSRAGGAGDIARTIAAEVGTQGRFGFVTAAFLQHLAPDLIEAVEVCVQQGAEKIVVVPFFLQMGMHVTADIPLLLDQAKKRYPNLRILTTEAVGSHPQMAEIVVDLVRESDTRTITLEKI
jgi:sirohydrochlorin ferrochelatase